MPRRILTFFSDESVMKDGHRPKPMPQVLQGVQGARAAPERLLSSLKNPQTGPADETSAAAQKSIARTPASCRAELTGASLLCCGSKRREPPDFHCQKNTRTAYAVPLLFQRAAGVAEDCF